MSIRIGIGVDMWANRGVAFSPEYQAVLTEATAQGFNLPSAGQQAKQNTLMTSLISSGVFAKLDVLFVLANDGGSQFACINWKNPTGNKATLVSSPTFTTNQGFTGNGTSSFINTNFNAATQGVNYTLNNASRYAYVRTLVANRVIDGVDASTANSTTTFVSANQRINQSGSNISASFDFSTSGAGMKSIHRTSSTSVTCYNDTTASSGLTATSTGLVTSNQVILRSASSYGSHQISMYAMGASMISENTSLVNAFSTYLTSL
jgi:hypothetical protein